MRLTRSILTTCLFTLAALPSAADCLVSYKAKQDDPLRLHYGVATLAEESCALDLAASELSPRLETDGWQLLKIVAILTPEELEEAEIRAGDYFLRY